MPVLVVRGEHSESFREDRAARALAMIADGRLVTIANASHYVPMEYPARVAQLVLAESDA